MITGLFQVAGFVLFVMGLILIVRAFGLANRHSMFVKYRKLVGFPLVIVGGTMLVISLIS